MQYVSESHLVPTDAQEKLMSNIESEFKKKFPYGYVRARLQRIIGDAAIYVTVGLVDDVNQLTSGYRDNDPMLHKYVVNTIDSDFEVRLIQGAGISVNPDEGSYMAMSTAKVPFRKSKGDSKRVLETFKRHFARLRDELDKVGDNVYGRNRLKDVYFEQNQ